MSCLYCLTCPQLLTLILEGTLCVLVQTGCLAYGILTRKNFRKNILKYWCDLLILAQMWLILLCCGEAAYHMRDGFFYPDNHGAVRNLIGVLLLLSAGVCWSRDRDLSLPAAGLAGVLVLPWIEATAGKQFPWILGAVLFLWAARAAWALGNRIRKRRQGISAFSVKEAVDTMESGILFCLGEGRSQGQILLTNRKMQELIVRLSGSAVYSGLDFYEKLKEGSLPGGIMRRDMEPNLVYAFEDGTLWRFDLDYITIRSTGYVLLMASEVTRACWTMDQLTRQNRELSRKNLELKAMLGNMENICRTEETLRAKKQVHDLLGQQISLILRSVREHREPDPELLQAFEKGLPDMLMRPAVDCGHSLRMVARSFQSLGVSVSLEGNMPENPRIQRAFYEIAAEAMTNAVRHGGATEICITMDREREMYRLRIRDNGSILQGPVSEGGGLRGMRARTEELGGQFSYCTTSHFSILVTIPEGGTL